MIFPSLFVTFAHAAESAKYQLNYRFPGGPQVVESPADYVEMVFRFGLRIVGIIALGFLVYGGIRYILSAGNPSALADAKSQMLSALIGIALLLSSYVILNEINPELVNLENPVLREITPKAKFDLGELQNAWRELGDSLEAIKEKIGEIKKEDTPVYKAWLTAMPSEQKLAYFNSLDPLAQRNFIVTLSGLGIPFGEFINKIDGQTLGRLYDTNMPVNVRGDLVRKMDEVRAKEMYYYLYNTPAPGEQPYFRQYYFLKELPPERLAPMYLALKSDGQAEAFAQSIVQMYRDNRLKGSELDFIITNTYLTLPPNDRDEFQRNIRKNGVTTFLFPSINDYE